MTPVTWQPTASIETLKQRAKIISDIRAFFAERGVLEVETPILCHATVTDPHILSITANVKVVGRAQEQIFYLQTSPEYAMKRLLAAGSGAIFQMTKSFRQGEIGRIHNPEFSMLEWYRPGYDHYALMNEMDELLQQVLQLPPATRMTTAEIYEDCLSINPHTVTLKELRVCAEKYIEPLPTISNDKNSWLDLLFTHEIEPHLGKEAPFFLYDFPVSQAALAKIRQEDLPVASRFEMYYKGVELANGFHELQDAAEQRQRFENDLVYRAKHNIPPTSIDERFLAALQHGLPDCAGVALGLDRLIMLVLNYSSLSKILSFAFESA
jgi:lysyl-tRNA synthetase class 2